MSLPIIAIIGRPNVGKSTVFNCFLKQRKAIVSDIPGTTRDSLMERIQGENFTYWLVDTAGLTNARGDSLEKEIQLQAKLALENADMIIFLVDGKKELTADDEHIVSILRKSKKPVIFVANKIDDGNINRILELARFGFGNPLPISAKNYTGLWELEEVIETHLEKAGFEKTPAPIEFSDDDIPDEKAPAESIIKVAFLGRPNVGKSSLLNALVKENRSVVSDVAGTTRDTIDTSYETEDGQKFLFLDTAGLRRPGKIGKDLDFWSSVRTREAMERADVCALLVDALDGITHQDLAIAGKIIEAGKGIIICVNKFDLVREKTRGQEESDTRDLSEVKMWGEELDQVRQKYLTYLSDHIRFLPWAPVLFFSAKTGKGVDDVLVSAKAIYHERTKRISTAELNRFLPEVYYGHVLPTSGTIRGTIKYLSQVAVSPPKFIFFVNNAKAFHFSYRRYLENKIREKYGFHGTSIQIEVRDSHDDERTPKKRKLQKRRQQ
ncbi:ribosome biogenesis GTPase Der [Candidatus Gracilibacteria bacterium]|nr:ribosome biogenesis GTPase Der [Candidatus Gracilibacteria bacterium]